MAAMAQPPLRGDTMPETTYTIGIWRPWGVPARCEALTHRRTRCRRGSNTVLSVPDRRGMITRRAVCDMHWHHRPAEFWPRRRS
ncbi:hypothetical protein SEA_PHRAPPUCCINO_158 [Mycobacterium phage Phrappuccino]|uniref:Uncharacterized protein n=1 Tax=Mycobacterium phage Phrappuccino TaxID=2591223 RepID=A0A514DDZ0_9CAUD|nr:hypothetical protein KHQ87_gp158 [Mycobacterium phage Phrappuccino]QDH91833.1 hypothetical protein SEA_PHRAPPUCCINO_158 [Mycobacterium phage Phrappuccino]QIQ63275.1 hypothetical protein SEA_SETTECANDELA_158 [Mycobacterium phage Settecandela]